MLVTIIAGPRPPSCQVGAHAGNPVLQRMVGIALARPAEKLTVNALNALLVAAMTTNIRRLLWPRQQVNTVYSFID